MNGAVGHAAFRSVLFFSVVGGAEQLGQIIRAKSIGNEVEVMHYDLK